MMNKIKNIYCWNIVIFCLCSGLLLSMSSGYAVKCTWSDAQKGYTGAICDIGEFSQIGGGPRPVIFYDAEHPSVACADQGAWSEIDARFPSTNIYIQCKK